MLWKGTTESGEGLQKKQLRLARGLSIHYFPRCYDGLTMTKPTKIPIEVQPDMPVSARIRQRIEQAGKRFHANDNIAQFVNGEAS